MDTQFEKAIQLIDEKNAKDLNKESFEGIEYSKEILYSKRMSQKLIEFQPDASQELQIAARAQHICRWKIPRSQYPMGKVGYLNWRNDLKKMHSKITSEILEEVGCSASFTEKVSSLITKKALKRDPDAQTLEDVVCLVFLQYYFDAFAAKHTAGKTIDIVQKTWRKMSTLGQEAALKLELSSNSLSLIKQAIN